MSPAEAINAALRKSRVISPLRRLRAKDIELGAYLKLFYAAQQKYFDGEFEDAKKGLAECFRFYSEDKVARLLVNRCVEFQMNGGPVDWDGAFKMLEK
jgi:hypothetical protein